MRQAIGPPPAVCPTLATQIGYYKFNYEFARVEQKKINEEKNNYFSTHK